MNSELESLDPSDENPELSLPFNSTLSPSYDQFEPSEGKGLLMAYDYQDSNNTTVRLLIFYNRNGTNTTSATSNFIPTMVSTTDLTSTLDSNSLSTLVPKTYGSTEEEDMFYKNLFIIICYSLIIFVSLCGNALVLRVIASRKKIQTTTNILIASLAISDVLTTTLNIPFNVTRFIAYNYPFGAVVCKLVPFIQVCCVYVSTLTMGVIAIHRHLTLTGAHSGSASATGGVRGGATSNHRRLWAILAIVWIIAGLLAVPHSMFNEIKEAEYKNETLIRCRAEYPKIPNLPFWLSVEAFLTQYL